MFKSNKNMNTIFKTAAFFVVFFILVAVFIYFAVFYPYFNIKSVKIIGAERTDKLQIENITQEFLNEKIANFIPQNNFLLTPTKKIKGKIISSFWPVKKVDIEKDFSTRSLIIKIQERQALAVWCRVFAPVEVATSSSEVTVKSDQKLAPEVDKCFFIDDDGLAFEQAPILSGGLVTTVFSQSQDELELGKKVTDKKTLDFILALNKQFSLGQEGIGEFLIKSQNYGDLEVQTSEGWQILFDSTRSADEQVSALKKVLEQEIKEKRPQLEYIDLRVPNRVYYKYK